MERMARSASSATEALAVSRDCLNSYREALNRGKALWIMSADAILTPGCRKITDPAQCIANRGPALKLTV